MEYRCPTCGKMRNELAFQRLIDGHVMKTRECIHCISAAAKKTHRDRKRRAR